ncbi:MAG: RluA family pseudouridine synthase [Ruminococcus sp.]|nr:RluA family pseudouridine synthase [Ruminococcus sp.]
MREFTIMSNDSGQRLDKFLLKAMPDLPKSMMYRLIRKKDIKINGKRCEISAKLCEGDVVRVYVKDDVSAVKKHDMSFLKADTTLDIIYEDENILIAYKPMGLDSHGNGENSEDTLINRIKLYLCNKKEYLPEEESTFAPALCSRLDRNTSGIVTAAKNAAALREMNDGIKNGYVHKIYQCITVGKPPKSRDILTAYHYRQEGRNIVRISNKPLDGYKEIKTGYTVLEQKNDMSLLEIKLYTGRTHQIRAHLAHIGCPILGDGKYGNIAANKRHNLFRQALCAYRLEFDFPDNSSLAYLNEIKPECPYNLEFPR